MEDEVKARVSLAGGKLEIDSAPGRGTQLSACLPLPEGAQDAASNTPRR